MGWIERAEEMYARKDLVKNVGDRALHLSIGCGKLQDKNTDDIHWVNIDKVESLDADLCLDIRTEALPFEAGSVDHIKAYAMLGQIQKNEDFLFVMNEFHRVLKPEGTIFILVPHKDFDHAFQDPFNQRKFNELSWQAFDETHGQYVQHLEYYGFKPWKDVATSMNNGFIVVNMTVSK